MADEGSTATAEQQQTAENGGEQQQQQRSGEEQLGDAGKRALQAEREARTTAEKAARDAQAKLKELEDARKSDEQKREEAAAEALKEAETAKSKALRYEVAASKNIPLKHAHRLQGSTKEELETDAEELAKELRIEETPEFDGGPRGESRNGSDFDSQIRRAARR